MTCLKDMTLEDVHYYKGKIFYIKETLCEDLIIKEDNTGLFGNLIEMLAKGDFLFNYSFTTREEAEAKLKELKQKGDV